MGKDKPKFSQRIVMSSSHVDKHGTVMTKEALESALKFINGARKPRLGLEHNQTFPPLGRISNGEVIKGGDGAYYLVADQEYFDTLESLTLPSGLELIRESFSGENFPFVECESKPREQIEILYDSVNFDSYQNGKDFIKELQDSSEIEFNGSEIMRKSEIPDPEIVFRLTEILVFAIGLGLRKIPEKLGEAIGDDLVKFYKLFTNAIKKSISELNPKNKPIHFIVELPIEKTIVDLVVTTRNPDVAIKAYKKDTIKKLKQEIEICITSLNAEKVQYFLNEENKWELNYLLTKDGKVIGTKKSFKKRDDFFQEMIKKQMDKGEKNNA
jgi:hypothetical protein